MNSIVFDLWRVVSWPSIPLLPLQVRENICEAHNIIAIFNLWWLILLADQNKTDHQGLALLHGTFIHVLCYTKGL